jgi:hypothetical protein
MAKGRGFPSQMGSNRRRPLGPIVVIDLFFAHSDVSSFPPSTLSHPSPTLGGISLPSSIPWSISTRTTVLESCPVQESLNATAEGSWSAQKVPLQAALKLHQTMGQRDNNSTLLQWKPAQAVSDASEDSKGVKSSSPGGDPLEANACSSTSDINPSAAPNSPTPPHVWPAPSRLGHNFNSVSDDSRTKPEFWVRHQGC